MTELDRALRDTLARFYPDFEKARELIKRGADVNALETGGEGIIEWCLLECCADPPECEDCDEDSCLQCEKKKNHSLIEMVDFFIENGWDTASQGLSAIATLVHTSHDERMLYAAKRILERPLSESAEDYEGALETIGAEESYQRCCERCHGEENLYFAMYEAVEARMEGRDFKGILPYKEAIGKRVDKVVYFSDKPDFTESERGTEYNYDLGLVCGDDVIIVTSGVNVFLNNGRISEVPQTDVSAYFDGVIGETVCDVLFEHKDVYTKKANYGQAIIIIKFDSGKEIRFTHDFGEQEEKEWAQARFVTDKKQREINERIEKLFDLCARTEIDLENIEEHIVNSKMTGEDVTRTALRLADRYSWEIDSFRCENERAPDASELVTTRWPDLFRALLRYGLNTSFNCFTDLTSYGNILWGLTFLDNGSVIYELFRILFENGADPNTLVNDKSVFEYLDETVVIDATLCEIEGEGRAVYEKFFRLWLLFMAYGGRLNKNATTLKMNSGYGVEIFKACEDFSYKKEITADDWFLHVYNDKTKDEVAVL